MGVFHKKREDAALTRGMERGFKVAETFLPERAVQGRLTDSIVIDG